MESVPCNLCGGDDSIEVATRGRGGASVRNVLCRKCTLVYVNPRPTPEELAEWYRNGYHQEYGHIGLIVDGGVVYPGTPEFDAERMKDVLFRVDTILKGKQLGASSRFLEIGCRHGPLLKRIHDLTGCQVEGIEPSEDESERARQDGIPVFTGILESYDCKQPFDAIAMFHVLEHFIDPLAGLKKLRGMLKPDGVLFIEVPNLYEPYGYLEDNFFQSAHLYSFSPQTLDGLFTRAGFAATYLTSGAMLATARLAEPAEPDYEAGHRPDDVLARLEAYRRYFDLKLILTEHSYCADAEAACKRLAAVQGDETYRFKGVTEIASHAVERRQFRPALYWLEQLIRLGCRDPEVNVLLVRLCFQMRDRKRARNYLKRLRTQHPGHEKIPLLQQQMRAIRG